MKRVFRLKDVCETYGLSRSTVYRLVAAGKFPKPLKIGISAVGWDADALDAWFDTRREGAQ